MIKRSRGREGQAAVEFLMTYGWMLLVVLIVSALILTFFDFGNLLPNRLELSGIIQGDSTQVVANSEENTIQFVFTYIGPKAITIDLGDITVKSNIETNACANLNLTNTRTGAFDQNSTNSADSIQFINGQKGLVKVDCANQLIENDVFEGKVEIKTKDSETKLEIPIKGRIRVRVT